MSYELQKVLVIESYKATDLHEFVKMCRYTNQILRNVNNKSRREEFSDDVEREEVIVIVNSNQTIRTLIDQSRVLDLKSLNSNLNRTFALSLNHQKIR
jgi:hypothetical protein